MPRKSRKSRLRKQTIKAEALPNNLTITGTAAIQAEDAAEGQAAKRPTFEIDAYSGGILRLVGWYAPVVIDLSGLRAGAQTTVLLNHDHDQIVGQGKATISASGITVVGQITGDFADKAEAAGKVVLHARGGFNWAASIGASADSTEEVEAGIKVNVNGKEFVGPLAIVRAGRLGEVSFVGVGADETASAKVAAAAAGEINMEFSQWLQARGIDESKIDEPTKKALQAAFDAEKTPERPVKAQKKAAVSMPTLDEQINEQKRQEAIKAMASKAGQGAGIPALERLRDVGTKCIEDGLSVEAAETKIERAARPVIGGFAPPPPQQTQKVMEAALLLHCGISGDTLVKDRDYGEPVVEAAWEHRRDGLCDIVAASMVAAGITPPRNAVELYSAAVEHRRQLKAGFSTVDLTGLLGAVANKLLLDSFTSVEAIYPFCAQQAEFNNFQTHTIYRLDHTGEFAQIGATGELKHGKLAESNYTNKLETSGQMLTLTRQAIINDDVNALVQLNSLLGRKARLAVEKAFVNALMESADSFYTAGRGNLITSNPLGLDGLGAAEAALMAMTDADGEPIYAMPKILIVPPALLHLARNIFKAELVTETTTANKARPASNVFAGRFGEASSTLFTSPYMINTALDGYHASGWYMLADPSILPAFQVAYLTGKRQPTIESSDAEFNTLGVQMRCFFDFGVSQIDYRGAISNDA